MVTAMAERISPEDGMDFSNLTKENIDKLVEAYKHLVPATISKKFSNSKRFISYHGLGQDDLEQFGLIGLGRAIIKYDPSKGTQLKSFAITYIRGYIMYYAKKDSLYNKKNDSFDLLPSFSLDTLEMGKDGHDEGLTRDILEAEYLSKSDSDVDSEIKLMFQKLEGRVTDRVLRIVRYRLEGYKNYEIAKFEGVSRQLIDHDLNLYKLLILDAIKN